MTAQTVNNEPDSREKWNTRAILAQASAITALEAEIVALWLDAKSKQAKIDQLMLEYCPSEMTREQLEEWGAHQAAVAEPETAKFKPGDKVRKKRGAHWSGAVVGTYSTSLTPEGYAVESQAERGSVQIYPAEALERTLP